MSLSVERVKEIVKSQPQRSLISEAVRHQNRISLHTASEITKNSRNPYQKDFLASISSLLPKDKFQRFNQLLKTPFVTLGISNEVFSEFGRIFDGQNPFFNYEFKNPNDSDDWNDYTKKVLKDKEFFKSIGFEQLKYCINSILVVDLPSEQVTAKPEPYYYFVQIENIIHLDITDKGEIKTIIFNSAENIYNVYDSESYRKFEIVDGIVRGEPVEKLHDLGYCPASFFWNWNLRKDNRLIKKSPFTDSLSNLDKYLALETFKEHADLYSSFPIVVSIEKDCSFEGCQEGYIAEDYNVFNEFTQSNENHVRQTKCPACESRSMIGAGTNFVIPATVPDGTMNKPVEIVSADIKPLEYLKAKLDNLSSLIKQEIIGSQSKAINEQAINEMQVLGSFESRLNVLNKIKRQFELIHKFANDTAALLRYGDSFISSTIFYGDEFYLKSIEKLQEEYKQAKDNGEPDDEIDAIYRKIIQYKYKGNTDKIQRAWILLNLNPEPHKTVIETKELFEVGAISESDFIIKSRFNNFIARFEREQTNVLTFGENLDFDKKIKTIYSQLINYANESKQIQQGDE